MENLNDYSQIFGIIDNWNIEKLSSEIEKYEKEDGKISSQISKLENYIYSLRKNYSYFKKRKRELYLRELEKNFVLKPEHKLILKTFEINFNGEKGSIQTDGLGYLYQDYIQLIFNKNKYDLSEKQQDELLIEFNKLMDEIPFAIKKLSE